MGSSELPGPIAIMVGSGTGIPILRAHSRAREAAVVSLPPITEISRDAPSAVWSCRKCRRVTADALFPGEFGRGRTPANAYLMSCAEIFALGKSLVTVRNRYSISSFEG